MGKVQAFTPGINQTLPKVLHEKWNWDIIWTINNGELKSRRIKKNILQFFLQPTLLEFRELASM
jgi:DNA-binding HxlR family transcriptional regulator